MSVLTTPISLRGLFHKETERKMSPAVRAKPFLTPSEQEFLLRLEKSAPEMRFHVHVALSALLDPVVGSNGVGSGLSHQQKKELAEHFNGRVVGYVAQCRQKGTIVALIELDGLPHQKQQDVERDMMISQAGYHTIRFDATNKPSAQAIRKALRLD